MYSYMGFELDKLISLIRESQEGADEAFSELVSRYMPLIKARVAFFDAPPGDNPEALQEARIALHNAALTYDFDRSESVTFGIYAGVCISNRLRSYFRQNARIGSKLDGYAEAEKLMSGIDVESIVATRDICDRVLKTAASVLSDFEFEVFKLSFENYSVGDIAAKLGRPSKSIENAKFRISRRLRDNKEIRDFLSY